MPSEFQSVLLDLSDPMDYATVVMVLMNAESDLRLREQSDAVDPDWPVTSSELLDQAARLRRMRLSLEAQVAGEGS